MGDIPTDAEVQRRSAELHVDSATPPTFLVHAFDDAAVRAILGVVPFQLLAHDLAAARGVAIDTARYPQL